MQMTEEHIAAREELNKQLLKEKAERARLKRANRLKKRVRRMKWTIPQIEAALRSTRGNITKAADFLACERKWLGMKIQDSPYLMKVQEDIANQIVDLCEEKLIEHIEDSNLTAIMFMLKTKGKNRGYSEKATIEHEVGPELAKNSAALIDAMKRGGKELEDLDNKAIDVGEYSIWDEASHEK